MSRKLLFGKQTGFTIIEILIVIVVIGILTGLVLVAYPSYQQSARDTKRKSDLHTIADAYKTALTDSKTRSDLNFAGWYIPNYGDSLLSSSPTLAGNVYNTSSPGGALGSLGYIKETLMDPMWRDAPQATSSTIQYSGYLLIQCWNTDKGVYAVARLERPSSKDLAGYATFMNQVNNIPADGSNGSISVDSCFYSPAGENAKEEADRNETSVRINKGYHVKLTLENSNNGYNYVVNVK